MWNPLINLRILLYCLLSYSLFQDLFVDVSTSTFSPPLSDRTHDGNPYSPTASTNKPRTVSALLLSDAHRYTGILEYLPIPQSCKTIHHLLTFRKCKVVESLKNNIITGL